MNKLSLFLLAVAFMVWNIPISGQSTYNTNPCQFYYIQESKTIQCVESEDTTYEKNSVKILWPVMLNGKDCSNLKQELIKSLTGRDDIHQIDQAVNYYIYTDTEGQSYDLESRCHFVNEGSNNPWQTSESISTIELKSLNDRVVTFHMFDYAYYAGAVHALYSNTYLTYDIELDKVVTLEDVVMDFESLRPAIMQSMKETFNYTEENLLLSEDGLPPMPLSPRCFYFDNATLHIVYQVNELSGFALGTIDVPVYSYLLGDEVNPSAFTQYGIELMHATRVFE